jgi:hypothetical protein
MKSKSSVRKKITILLVATLFFLALIPAFYPLEDEALRGNGFFGKTYSQLFTAVIAIHDFGFSLCSLTIASSMEIPCILPNALPASSETRAPPA